MATSVTKLLASSTGIQDACRDMARRRVSRVSVVVQPGGDHAIEAMGGDFGEVLLRDEAAIREEDDFADGITGSEVLQRARERCDVRGVTHKDVMRDRDAVGGDQEADDDGWAVFPLVAAVTMGEGNTCSCAYPMCLEARQGDVVADRQGSARFPRRHRAPCEASRRSRPR
jgi:hypothetical protein